MRMQRTIGTVRRPRASWQPMQLLWRRPPKQPAAAAMAARSTVLSHSWATSLHLHFSSTTLAARLNTMNAGDTARMRPAAASAGHARHDMAARPSTASSAASLVLAPSQPHIPRGASAPFNPRASMIQWPVHSSAPRTIPAPMASGVRMTPASMLVHARPWSRPGMAFQRQPQGRPDAIGGTFAGVALAGRRPLASLEEPEPRALPAPPPALVWRQPERPPSTTMPAAALGTARPASIAHSAQSVVVTQGSHSTAAPTPPTPETVAAAVRQQLRAVAVAPAMVDNLAAEVLRRVERSMRIERERRGR